MEYTSVDPVGSSFVTNASVLKLPGLLNAGCAGFIVGKSGESVEPTTYALPNATASSFFACSQTLSYRTKTSRSSVSQSGSPAFGVWTTNTVSVERIGQLRVMAFKVRKLDLIADGYDPGKIKGPLYFRDPKKGYLKVTKGVFEKLSAGLVKV